MYLSSKVMPGETKWCLLLIASLTWSISGGAVCEHGRSWWDRQQEACVPCTRCDPALRLAVKYPCELHRDTVCQPLYELKLFHKDEVTISNEYEYSSDYDYDYVGSDDKWDVQTSTLTVAASGCVIFFVVVLCMSLYHAKQWRILKRALKSDVQDLSAKLKLMESGSEPQTEPVVPTVRHIYCNIHVTKDSLLGPPTGKKGLGNVYTQEKHCS